MTFTFFFPLKYGNFAPILFFSKEPLWPLFFHCPIVEFHSKKKKIILQGLFGACILTIGSRFRLTLTLKVLHDKSFFAILNRAFQPDSGVFLVVKLSRNTCKVVASF